MIDLDKEETKKLKISAIISNLNVLSYIAKYDTDNFCSASPWGQDVNFIELIGQHLNDLAEMEIVS